MTTIWVTPPRGTAIDWTFFDLDFFFFFSQLLKRLEAPLFFFFIYDSIWLPSHSSLFKMQRGLYGLERAGSINLLPSGPSVSPPRLITVSN